MKEIKVIYVTIISNIANIMLCPVSFKVKPLYTALL